MVNSNEAYTQEEQERIDAVNRYHRGERTSKIYKSLGRSRSWLQKWTDLGHIRSESIIFLMRRNNRQDWMNRKIEMGFIPHRKLPGDSKIEVSSMPITEGEVHFIRQVKGDGTISVLNEDFDVGESLVNEYVWANIDTKQERLMIYYRGKDEEKAEIIKIYEYVIGESIERFKDKF